MCSGCSNVSRLLAGRVHAKIEDEYPEISDGLLQFLYPHFLAPIPSMALVQFEADPTRVQAPQGFTMPAGSMIDAATEPVACKFRTAYPVALWPIRVNRASFRVPPFPPGLQPPAGTVAAGTCIELECVGDLSFAQLKIEALRFFLAGDPQRTPDLYEVLLNPCVANRPRAPAKGGQGFDHPRRGELVCTRSASTATRGYCPTKRTPAWGIAC